MHPIRAVTLISSLAGALLAASGGAAAEDGLYLAGALGDAQQSFDESTFNAHGNPIGYKFALGFRPIDLLAAELSYIDFGRAFSGISYEDTNAVGVFALAFVPIPVVDLYGKVGLADWRTDAQSPFLGFHRTGADLAYGLGAGTSWGRFGVRLEYERYQISHSNDMGMASLGATWVFL
jgi:outer membrane protein with beta-barrel domain